MEHSESIAKLAAALVKIHAEVENAIKNAENPHLNVEYADLTEVLRVTKPVFNKHGVAVVQMPGMNEDRASLLNVLMHDSGEWMAHEAQSPLPPKQTKKGTQPADSQSLGSALSYLRRYSLAAMAGITQEDDDGHSAQGSATISNEQLANIEDWIMESGADRAGFLKFLGVSNLADLPAKRYSGAIAALKAKAEKVLA